MTDIEIEAVTQEVNIAHIKGFIAYNLNKHFIDGGNAQDGVECIYALLDVCREIAEDLGLDAEFIHNALDECEENEDAVQR